MFHIIFMHIPMIRDTMFADVKVHIIMLIPIRTYAKVSGWSSNSLGEYRQVATLCGLYNM